MNEPSAYPEQITAALVKRWGERGLAVGGLADVGVLTEVIDVVYQASLLQEEGDPMQVRVVMRAAMELNSGGTHADAERKVIQFDKPMAFTPQTVRKLAPAVGYYRSMLAVRVDAGAPVIWGIMVTGTQWVNRPHVDTAGDGSLPQSLILHALAPGHVMISYGAERLVEVSGGKLLTEGFDPFASQWLPQRFAHIREGLITELTLATSSESASRVDHTFIKHAAQSVMRRVLRLVRTRRHGGLLIYLPEDSVCADWVPQWLRFRVRFQQGEAANRFRTMLQSLLARTTEVGRQQGIAHIQWADYLRMRDPQLAEIEAEMTEFASFLADLMGIDGALVLNQRFQIIGFGAEILGDSHVSTIARALDLEATEVQLEPADTAGTRHRSAYRLVSAQPAVIAVVVSQDGEARFVAHHRDQLTYWPYLP